MPTVPTYTPGQVRNQGISARQSIQAPADAFGSNVAQSITQLGTTLGNAANTASDVAVQQIEAFDEATLREKDAELSSFIRNKLDDPQSGYFSLRGKDALNAREDLQKEIEAYEKTIRGQLDPRIANDWNKSSSVRLQNARQRLADHARREFESWEDATFAARLENQQAEAASFTGNPKEINKSIAVGMTDIDRQAERRGWGKDVVDAKKRDFYTNAHVAVINRLIAQGTPSAAELYFGNVRGKLDPTKVAQVENTLRTHTIKAKAQRATDEIMANATLDYAGQMDAARQIEDADVRDQVESMVRQRQAEEQRIKTQNENDAEDQITKHFANGGTLETVEAGLWDRLSGAGQARINSYLLARAEKALNPKDPIAGKRAYYQLRELAHADYSTFKRTWNPQLYVGIMDTADIDKLAKMAESEVSAKSSVSTEDTIKQALGSLGYEWKDRLEDNTDGERIRAFIESIDNRISSYVAQHNKEPSGLEINKWILEETRNNYVRVDDTLYNPQRPMGTVTADEYRDTYVTVRGQDVYLREIPDTARAAIISNLQKRGMPVNEYSIADYWQQSQAYLTARQQGQPTADDLGTNDVPTAQDVGVQ
jgi:hypothetical protein